MCNISWVQMQRVINPLAQFAKAPPVVAATIM